MASHTVYVHNYGRTREDICVFTGRGELQFTYIFGSDALSLWGDNWWSESHGYNIITWAPSLHLEVVECKLGPYHWVHCCTVLLGSPNCFSSLAFMKYMILVAINQNHILYNRQATRYVHIHTYNSNTAHVHTCILGGVERIYITALAMSSTSKTSYEWQSYHNIIHTCTSVSTLIQ